MKRVITLLALAVLLVSNYAAAAEPVALAGLSIPLIASRDNNLPRDYVPELVRVPGTYFYLEQETLDAYLDMLADAKAAGHARLRLQSAYRSYETQHTLHERKVAAYKPIYGDRAREMAARVVARPGQSEHQLGNTIDIANGSLTQSFGKTAAGIWLAENSYLYGFILRYPEGTTSVTGVIYEPWHFRYVGKDIAKIIYDNDWTLEEFVRNANAQKEKSYPQA
ncbi:MAG: M15 family metallopeptidase [Oscillospiraceae bacterium]|nr:M15 family metallopeptidase [Oscillospiraceae bacterium]